MYQTNLILFATELSSTNSFSGVNITLSGIKFFAQKYGYESEFSSYKRLYLLLRGIKRTTKNRRKEKRAPVTPDLLRMLHFKLFNSRRPYEDKLMLWAAMLCAFFGFMRVSEFTSAKAKSFSSEDTLCYTDVKVIDSNCFGIQLKSSKTDPFRLGVQIRIAANGLLLCPVTALRKYIHAEQETKCRSVVWFLQWSLPHSTSVCPSHSWIITGTCKHIHPFVSHWRCHNCSSNGSSTVAHKEFGSMEQ